MLKSLKKFIGAILLAIIPLSLGSFLFVGVIESYKNNETFTKEILDSYKRIRLQRAECHKTHNKFFLSYYPYSGTLGLIKRDYNKLLINQGKGLPPEHIIWMKTLNENQSKQLKAINDLKSKSNECYINLYIQHEELAILLNDIIAYENLIKKRANELQETYNLEKETKKILKSITNEDMTDIFYKGIEKSIKSNKDIWITGLGELSEYYLEIGKNEEKRFNIELNTFLNLRKVYLKSIRARLDRGFIDYLIE